MDSQDHTQFAGSAAPDLLATEIANFLQAPTAPIYDTSGSQVQHTAATHERLNFIIYTQKEAAGRLRVSQRHLQRLEKRGQGPPRTNLGDRTFGYTNYGLAAWVRDRTA
jgi:hypothetical protein